MEVINNKLLLTRFKESGFKYHELVSMTNISRNTIYNTLNGKTYPTHFVANSLAMALNLTPEDIIAIFFSNIKFEEGTKKLHTDLNNSFDLIKQ